MKNCKITIPLNGEKHSFDNEVQAASFIRANKRAISLGLYKSPSFSKSQSGSVAQNKVVQELMAQHRLVHTNAGLMKDNKRYVGATKLWDIYVNKDGKRINKVFDSANWEVNKRKQLSHEYSTQFLIDKGIKPEELDDALMAELKQFLADKADEIDLMLALEMEGWDVKAKTGTVWHAIAEAFFNEEDTQAETYNKILEDWKDRVTVTPECLQQFLGELYKFREDLYTKHGRDAKFLPELIVTGDNTELQGLYDKSGGNPATIGGAGGILDLVVVDSAGKVHVYDYKTASKPVNNWHTDKNQGVRLQQMLYVKMLRKLGYNIDSSTILPIIFDDLDVPSKSVTKFHIEPTFAITAASLSAVEAMALSEVMPLNPVITHFNVGDKHEVFNLFSDLIGYEPEIEGQLWDIDKEVEKIKSRKRGSKYYFYDRTINKSLEIPIRPGENIDEAIKRYISPTITQYNENFANYPERVIDFWKKLKEVKEIGNSEALIHYTGDPAADAQLKEILGKYIHVDWHVVDDKHAQELGIVVFYNDKLNLYEFLNITSKNINEPFKGEKGSTLLGNILRDPQAMKLGFNKATQGDVETLKVYGYLKTNWDIYENAKVGQIITIQQSGTRLPNIHSQFTSHLERQWDKLINSEYVPAKYKKYNKKIEREDMFQTVFERIALMHSGALPSGINKYEFADFFNTYKEIVHDPDRYKAVTVEMKLEQLTNLFNHFRNYAEGVRKSVLSKEDYLTYRMAAQALLDLKDLFIAIESDYDRIGNIFGNKNTQVTSQQYINHPLYTGVYRLINQTMDATAQRLHATVKGMPKAFEKFYEATGGTAGVRVTGNPVSRFKNIMEFKDGKWTGRLKNPINDPTLKPAEVELIEAIADKIQEIRIAQLELSGEPEPYALARSVRYEMPVMKKSISSLLKRNLTDVKEIMREYTDYLLNENRYFEMDKESQARELAHLKTINVFEYTEPYNVINGRDKALEEQDITLLEDDLELLFYTYATANSKKIEGDKRLPLMNAYEVLAKTNSSIQLSDTANIAEAISDEISYTLFNKRKIDPGSAKIQSKAFAAKKATSMAILGGNFLAFPKEITQGFLNAFSKVMSDKALNERNISMSNLLKAGAFVISENTNMEQLVVCDEINKLFRIVSRSLYETTEKYIIGRKGMVNMENNAFWFYSAPDYMNRMSLCIAQMLEDGSLKLNGTSIAADSAIQIGPNGLTYDPKKDDRFSYYLANPNANPNPGNNKWEEQRSLYNIIREEHLNEMTPNAFDEKGNLTIPYSNKQTMSIRNQADRIYGAADPINKSAMDRAGFMALVTHFKTWALAKAKRYYMEGEAYESEGHYVNEYDKEGRFIGTVWQPTYIEGAWQTMQHVVNNFIETKDVIKSFGMLLPEQKQNLIWAINDLMIFALLTMLIGGGIKVARGSDVDAKDLNIFQKYMYKSFEDMNALNTLTALTGAQDNPIPTISFAASVLGDTWNVLTLQASPIQLMDNLTVFRLTKDIVSTAVDD